MKEPIQFTRKADKPLTYKASVMCQNCGHSRDCEVIGEPKNKPIQISTAACSDMNGSDIFSLTVLCNDGSIWMYLPNTSSWFELPEIPVSQRYLQVEE